MVNEKTQRYIYVISDLLTTALAWFTFNSIRFHDIIKVNQLYNLSFSEFLTIKNVWLGQLLYPLMMLGLYFLSGYYNKVFIKSRVEELTNTIVTAIIGTLLIYFIAIVDDPIPDRQSNYTLLLMLFLLMFAFVYLGRITITNRTNTRIARGQLRFNVLIVGTSKEATTLKRKLQDDVNMRSLAYNVVGYVATTTNSSTRALDLPVYQLSELPKICTELNISNLIMASKRNETHPTLELVYQLFPLNLPVLISPTLYELLTTKPKINRLIAEPLIDITHANMSESTANLKRAGDAVVSAITLILLLPIFVCIALAIKCSSKGKVIYSQERIGLRNRPFKIYKFRTMVNDAEVEGPSLSSANDPRITPVGRFLRKYRLDELPQFWNVLIGDMSIIGPRPERAFYINQIVDKAPYYMLLHQVRPGITSLGMVKHGYASNVNEMIDRLQYDLIYIENISLTVDLKILAYTVSTVLKGKGV